MDGLRERETRFFNKREKQENTYKQNKKLMYRDYDNRKKKHENKRINKKGK